jgi:hypothetical protein
MDRNELPLEPRHLGVPSGTSKMIPEPMVHLAQIVHLSCANTNTISKHTEIGFDMARVILELHRVRPNRFLSLWYIRANHATILHQDWHYLKTDRNKLPLEPRHLRVPSGASKRIF